MMVCTYESHIACHILVGPFLIYSFAIYNTEGGGGGDQQLAVLEESDVEALLSRVCRAV